MEMKEWAKREVELACKQEAPDRKDGEFDYGCACYESALKAFESLLEDDHTSFSISLTKGILNRLIDGKPLTPIEDIDDVWNDISDVSGLDGEEVNYQCKRMSSLFKYVYPDGSVKYCDVDRDFGFNVNSKTTYQSGLLSRIANEMFPITMPYYPPSNRIMFKTSEFLMDKKNGDYDTVHVIEVEAPDGTVQPVNRYFKDGGDSKMEEIDEKEYLDRKQIYENRIK